jgi:hypothetical protein
MVDETRQTDEARQADAKQAEAKRIEDNKKAEDDRKKADEERRKSAQQQALVPNAEGNVMVEAIMGPYRGQHLTMTAADGQAAIDAHWARNPSEAIYEHEPLSDEDRKAAVDASHAWAQAQWDTAQGTGTPKEGETEGGVTRRRAIEPEDKPGGYTTRGAGAGGAARR